MRGIQLLLLGILVVAMPLVDAQPLSGRTAVGVLEVEIPEPILEVGPEGRSLTIEIEGYIACDGGRPPPSDAVVETAVPTDETDYFRVDAAKKTLAWTTSDSIAWTISEKVVFTFWANHPLDKATVTAPRLVLARDASDDSGCGTSGYVIHGDRDMYSLVRPPAPADPEPAQIEQILTPDRAGFVTVFLIGLLTGGAAGWLGSGRLRRPPV